MVVTRRATTARLPNRDMLTLSTGANAPIDDEVFELSVTWPTARGSLDCSAYLLGEEINASAVPVISQDAVLTASDTDAFNCNAQRLAEAIELSDSESVNQSEQAAGADRAPNPSGAQDSEADEGDCGFENLREVRINFRILQSPFKCIKNKFQISFLST